MVKRHRILSFLVCITLVTAFLGCASTPTRESSGEYIDDSAITTRVKAAIFDDPSLKVLQINVETFKGEVQLSGFVGSYTMGGFIHVLLVIAIVVILIYVIQGRKVL